MKYFGIVNTEDIVGLSVEEIRYFLLEKEIYDNFLTEETFEKLMTSNFEFGSVEIKQEPIPSLELIDEFNDFISKIYKGKLFDTTYNYFTEFNETFYGLDHNDLKKVALSDFNKIYTNLEILHVTLVTETTSENGIRHTHTTGKLFKLYYFQQEIKKSMATTENLINFLTGNKAFYDDDFFEQHVEIRDAVHLESIKQILVEINDKFNFEDDIYYSKKLSQQFKFKDYNHIFTNLKSYRFTNDMIRKFRKLKRSYIESLYQVLVELDLIKDHKENFCAFIYEEYKFKVTKITTFAPTKNIQNDKRVKLLTEKWLSHDVQENDLDKFFDI